MEEASLALAAYEMSVEAGKEPSKLHIIHKKTQDRFLQLNTTGFVWQRANVRCVNTFNAIGGLAKEANWLAESTCG